MNERILNRRSGGLFAVGEQSSPLRRPPRALGRRRRPPWPRVWWRPARRRKGRPACSGLLHGNAPTDQDHELITPEGLAPDRFRRKKSSRTARTSEHDSRVPTRDQPREACQARPARSGRLLIVARMVARLAYLLAAAPRAGAPFACLNCLPPSQDTTHATAREGCPRPR